MATVQPSPPKFLIEEIIVHQGEIWGRFFIIEPGPGEQYRGVQSVDRSLF